MFELMDSHSEEAVIKVIGVGGGGGNAIEHMVAHSIEGVEFIAMCDIDSEHLKSSIDELEKLQGTRPSAFKDYRDLLDVKELRAVFIG